MILIVNTTSDPSITDEVRKQLLDCENNNDLNQRRASKENRSVDPSASSTTDIQIIEAGTMEISHCIGCNYCWLKTPGVCSIHDDYEQILKQVVHADQLWVISDTALGFLNHKGKNIFDRILPIATMYLKFHNKQMRHVRRYKQTTDIGLIIKGECDREYLERWNKRAALNFGSKSLGVYSTEEVKEAVACMF
ncbi:MAG: flavodoxin family protein [Lachnospiraceae bacterium]|nr:flavodoxin family protein [Lachnospiraceae bacterium]